MQLLRITTTPMKYQFVTEAARLEYNTERGGYTMTKTGGTFDMRSQNTRVHMDATEFRNSMGFKSHDALLQDFDSRMQRAAQEAVAAKVDMGNQMMHIEKGVSIPDLLYSRLMQDTTAGSLQLTPLSPINMEWTPPELNVNYEPVRQSFDWRMARSSMQFVPSKFSLDIQQYASIQIEYLGGPVYVPPSADPNYNEG